MPVLNFILAQKIVILSYSRNRADRSEKRRKELEHICNFNEEKTEKDEKSLVLAKNTTCVA